MEAAPLVTKHSWKTAQAMWEIVCRWGKPSWVTSDNGLEFSGNFDSLCASVGITRRRITVGNSRANGQVERTIRTIKDVIRRCQSVHPESYWTDHVPTALMALRFTRQRTIGFPPYTLITG